MTTGGGTSTISTSAATGGSAGESATAPAGVDAGADNKSGGLGAAPTGGGGGHPERLALWQLTPSGPPARGRLVRRPTNRHGAPQHRPPRPASS
jgi:hypothetical protein